jgi:transposase InsO family protein
MDGSHVEPTDWVPERAGLDVDVVVTSELGLNDEDLAEYQRRLAVVRDRQLDRAQTWAELGARHGVSARMARYFWREFENYGEVELRPHQRKLTGPRVPVAMLELFEQLFRDSRTHRVKAILDSASMRGLARELGCRISYDQAKRYARELKKDPKILARRTGKKRLPLDSAFGPVDRFRGVAVPLQVVQVDATPVDIQTVGPDGESLTKRIWILSAVDVASRCFWAWRVCELEPTEIDFLKLVQMGIRDKDALMKEYGAYTPYPVHGVPQRIVTDRGWPFLGKTASVRLTERGIILEQAAPYRPEMKGIVERLFRTMNELFIHRLPGTTKSNPQQKGGRDAGAEARAHRLTIARFTRFYGRAVIDGYSDEVHSSLGCTPLEKWDKLVRQWGRVRPWPSDPASALLLSVLALKNGGTRHREGNGYLFMNRTFRPMKADAPALALVLYDPDDLRSVLLADPATGAVICEAQAVNLDTSAPIDEHTLAEMNRPDGATRPRKGREALTDIIAEVEAGKVTSRRGASRHAKALRVLKEKPASTATTGAVEGAPPAAAGPIELELKAQPDYAA